MNTTPVVVFDMNMIFGLCYMMWAIPTGTSTTFKKKNQVKSPSPESRTPNSVRIRQSGRSGIWGVTACVLDHKGSWEEHLPLVEFAYNNSYQASIQMAPYEALYGRPCRSPLCWTEVGESCITGPDLIRDTSEKVSLIRQRLLMAQSRQKSYADVRRRPLEFEVGDHVFLKEMPKRRVVRFGKRGKLSPRFIGPFEILERVGTVAYRLALPPSMLGVHEVFHVSMLQKYTPDPTHVVDWRQIEVDTDETFEEGPVCIVDSRDQVLRCKTVRLVLVLWRHHGVEESTWEREDTMRATYPFLFRDGGTWFSRLIFK